MPECVLISGEGIAGPTLGRRSARRSGRPPRRVGDAGGALVDAHGVRRKRATAQAEVSFSEQSNFGNLFLYYFYYTETQGQIVNILF
jgi:hypothetical protein